MRGHSKSQQLFSFTHIRIVQGSTSPVAAVRRVGGGVGESLAGRLDRGWKCKGSGGEEDAREEGDRNHAEQRRDGTLSRPQPIVHFIY